MDEKIKIKPNSPYAWLLAARPKTLTGAAGPVLIGCALVYAYEPTFFRWIPALLCLFFALVMQINANFINDFYDYAKGTDREDRLGPERACAQGWITIEAMKRGIALTTLTACAIGLPLIGYGGLEMIAVGIVCVLFAFLYTTTLSYKGWGDVLVLVFFGLVPVGFTFYVQLHTWTAEVTWAALAFGLVMDTLLMVNNYRDCEQDRISGKRTIVVRLGVKTGRWLYWLLGFGGCLLCLPLWRGELYWGAVLPWIYLIPHTASWMKMTRIRQGRALNQVLGETARNTFIFAVLLAIGCLMG